MVPDTYFLTQPPNVSYSLPGSITTLVVCALQNNLCFLPLPLLSLLTNPCVGCSSACLHTAQHELGLQKPALHSLGNQAPLPPSLQWGTKVQMVKDPLQDIWLFKNPLWVEWLGRWLIRRGRPHNHEDLGSGLQLSCKSYAWQLTKS